MIKVLEPYLEKRGVQCNIGDLRYRERNPTSKFIAGSYDVYQQGNPDVVVVTLDQIRAGEYRIHEA